MIKLFWNTHYQKKISSKNEKLERDHAWGIYHKKNSNTWIFEILDKVKFDIIENIENLKKDDDLIIIDSSIEEKDEFYTKIKLICSKVFLFHLGDESGFYDLSNIYKNCNYVFRTFCSNKYFSNDKVKCIPIGYKSGVLNIQKSSRKYKWAFVGTPHKSSRHDLLFQLSSITPSFCHKTEKFDKNIISVDKMNEVLSLTEFLPCPNGFMHPETYRVYEALEYGCIPIVEDSYKYYDRLFPNNPFLKINKWADAKPIISGWGNDEIIKKREECKIWWKNYKNNLSKDINNIIAQ